MTDTTSDRWAAGDAYDGYMGRWSRQIAEQFVQWLQPESAAHWLEVGCGTGALTSTICKCYAPASIVACDQSPPFVKHAQAKLQHPAASFVVAAADTLPTREGGFDMIVSGLVLNFIAETDAALAAMRRRVRPAGVIAAYIWDYAGGLEFLRYFWQQVTTLDPRAKPLDESHRFAPWTEAFLTTCFRAAGLVDVQSTQLTVPTTFANFQDYWTPFLGATGPAPSYVASLAPPQQVVLAQRLRSSLPSSADGTIRLQARALAVRGAQP